MSEANHWVLSRAEINDAVATVAVSEWATPSVAKAQYDKLAWGIVDWLFTHETGGSTTHGGRAWSARLVQELEDGGFNRPDG